jgi:hypothetical protein
MPDQDQFFLSTHARVLELLNCGLVDLHDRVEDLELRAILEAELGLAGHQRREDAVEHLRPHCEGRDDVELHRGVQQGVVDRRGHGDVGSSLFPDEDSHAVRWIGVGGRPSAGHNFLVQIADHLKDELDTGSFHLRRNGLHTVWYRKPSSKALLCVTGLGLRESNEPASERPASCETPDG